MTSHLEQLAAPPLFVLGTAGSGANWVYEFLMHHPKVAGLRESWLFAPPEPTDRARSEAAFAAALRPGHNCFVEKSAIHVFHIGAIAEAWPEARFVHVLRDGRDVALKVRAVAGTWPPHWVAAFGNSFRTAGAAWARAVDTVMDIQRSLGDRFLEIRFEKLNQDHYEVGKQILEFAGIEYTDSFVLQALAANERRLDLPEPPEPWKTNYSVWRALRFSRVAGEALIRAHYEEDRGWWFRPFKRS